jgi:hypothetical protein
MVTVGFVCAAIAVALMIVGMANLAQRSQAADRRVGAHGWSFVMLGLGCAAGSAQLFYLYGFQ